MRRLRISASRLFTLFLFFILSTASVYSENIRGKNAGILQIDGSTVELKPEELLTIVYPDEISAFHEGIEIQIQIPLLLRKLRNSFALMIYRSVSPKPGEGRNEYSGARIHMEIIPAREKTFVRIPFSETHGITKNALTSILPIPVSTEQFPLLAVILPIMKGIPDAAFSEKLIISAIPIWKNEGSLTINITNPSGNPEEIIEVTVDKEVIELNEAIELSAGIHSVRVASTHAPTIEETIALEPGEETVLNLELDYRPPELTIHIPEGAIVRLDGKLIETDDNVKVIVTDPRNHSISYTFGELEVSRDFTVQPGSRISINLLVDVKITERNGSGRSKEGE